MLLNCKTYLELDYAYNDARCSMEIIRSYLEYLQAMQIHDEIYKQTDVQLIAVNSEYSVY